MMCTKCNQQSARDACLFFMIRSKSATQERIARGFSRNLNIYIYVYVPVYIFILYIFGGWEVFDLVLSVGVFYLKIRGGVFDRKFFSILLSTFAVRCRHGALLHCSNHLHIAYGTF